MLQQIMESVCNYFDDEKLGAKKYSGTYEIVDGTISLPLLDGQRFLIQGSVLNDGVYTYHADHIGNDDDTDEVGLQDETWTGTICALAVPPAVIALSAEIQSWVDKFGEATATPYTSENVIGVYSYTKAQNGSGAGGAVTWQDAFKDRLKRWRKVAF